MRKISKYMLILFTLLAVSLSPIVNKNFAVEASSQAISKIDTNEFLTLLNANKGKLILVNFFASWCPPCVEEIPDFVKIASQHPQKDILIIGLSLDEDPKALENFMKEHKINYPVFYASRKLASAYNVYSIPQNIVYDQKLKAIYNKVGILSYDQIIEMLNPS